MSRSGYIEDSEQWDLIRWRGAVASAIRGKRGQALLQEMIVALDALPEKSLIAGELEDSGQVCALGAVGLMRGIDMKVLDVTDYESLAKTFGVSEALIREIEYENDEYRSWKDNSGEHRFKYMRRWAEKHLRGTA